MPPRGHGIRPVFAPARAARHRAGSPVEPPLAMRTKGSARFAPYYKVQGYDARSAVGSTCRRRIPTAAAARAACRPGVRCRVMEITERGRRPLAVACVAARAISLQHECDENAGGFISFTRARRSRCRCRRRPMPPGMHWSRRKTPVARLDSARRTRCRARARALCYRRPVQRSSRRRVRGLESARPPRASSRAGRGARHREPAARARGDRVALVDAQGSGMALSLPAALARVVTARDTP